MWVQFGPKTKVVLLLNVTRPLSQRPAGNREVLRPRRAASQGTQTIPHYTTPHSSTRSLLHLFFSCTLLGLEVMLFAWAARLILSIFLSDGSSKPRNNVQKWEQKGCLRHTEWLECVVPLRNSKKSGLNLTWFDQVLGKDNVVYARGNKRKLRGWTTWSGQAKNNHWPQRLGQHKLDLIHDCGWKAIGSQTTW